MKYPCKKCGKSCYSLAFFCNDGYHFSCPEQQWYVYILECNDKTLYTGSTNNLEKRIAAHNANKGAKYTKGRTPVTLIKSFEFPTKSEALKREYQIKQLSREDKLKL